MTPGSAGGELGDHRALRWDETIPGLVSRRRCPVCPSRNLPPVSANHGRNLRSVGSAPFTMAQHGTPRRSPSHCHTDLEVQRGRCSPEAVVEAMFSLDAGCLADKQAVSL